MRQDSGDSEPPVRGYAVTHPHGPVILPRAEGWDQLIYAASGVMTVHTGDGVWVVPPDRAVWVPSGVGHRIEMAGRTAIRTLYFASGLAALPRRCVAVNVPPLLRELILHVLRTSPLDLREPAHERLVGVLLDQLDAAPVAPLRLPLPVDPRARRVADAVRADLARPVAPLARAAGASRRTLERLFRAETGLSVGQWRERMRLVTALRLLAEGEPVTRVAHAVGYATPSAFGAMFVRQLGVSPARYFAPAGRRHAAAPAGAPAAPAAGRSVDDGVGPCAVEDLVDRLGRGLCRGVQPQAEPWRLLAQDPVEGRHAEAVVRGSAPAGLPRRDRVHGRREDHDQQRPGTDQRRQLGQVPAEDDVLRDHGEPGGGVGVHDGRGEPVAQLELPQRLG